MNQRQENVLVIEVPGAVGGGTLVFSNNQIHFKGKSIKYSEVESMSFHALKQSVNLIPVSQTYKFMIASSNTKLSFSVGSTLHIGRKAKEQAWQEVVTVSMALIAPIIVNKLADRIFGQGIDAKIGNITFSSRGYSKTSLFGGTKEVLWTDKVYSPIMISGRVILMEDKQGRSSKFAAISTTVPNAVVVPGLIQECVNRAS